MSTTAVSQSLLRLVTCGSVDDGKSTLIGRLLYDAKGIYEDQLASVKQATGRYGTTGGEIDLALLTDGLKAEREQGITIDVAYRYFSTPRRDFIIADCPGHEQYTRNMATGASTADVAILLIDARHGVVTQTRRHAFIVRLLGIRHVVLAVNKMDLADWSKPKFDKIVADFNEANRQIGLTDVHAIPMSALLGDNVTHVSDKTPWYDGLPMLELLEGLDVTDPRESEAPARLPVQIVSRPNMHFRGYQGTIAGGQIAVGDEIAVMPANIRAKVKEVFDAVGPVESAPSRRAVTITLDREVDASRGDVISVASDLPRVSSKLIAHVVWFSPMPMSLHEPYRIKQATRLTNATVASVKHRIDVNTLEKLPAKQLQMNDIALCVIEASRPLAWDRYEDNRTTGSFILIDRVTGNTVAAGMIDGAVDDDTTTTGPVSAGLRAARLGQRPAIVNLSGDAMLARATADQLDRKLLLAGHVAAIVDEPDTKTRAAILRTLREAGLIALVLNAAPDATDAIDQDVVANSDPIKVADELFSQLDKAGWLTGAGEEFNI
ncbi:MAG: sulfate adenylyltransferase subunit CysN [Tepidisphaeraceae bacterium]